MKLQNTPQPPPPGRGFSLKRVSDPFPGETRLGKMGQSTPGAGSRLLEDTDRPAGQTVCTQSDAVLAGTVAS